MPNGQLRDYLVTTVCVAFIVGIAFLAAYAGRGIQAHQNTPRVESDQYTKGSTESQTDSDRQQQNSDKKLPPINTGPSPDLNKESGTNRNESAEEGSEYWPILIFGFSLKITDSLLAVFTLFLVIIGAYQGWQLLKTVTITEDIAEASVALESPILVMGRRSASSAFPTEIVFTNCGRSPAIIIADCLILKCAEVLPDTPIYGAGSIVNLGVESVIDNGGSHQVERKNEVTSEEWNDVSAGRKILWAYGYVEYMTFLKIKRREGFCVAFRPVKLIFYSYRLGARPKSLIWLRRYRGFCEIVVPRGREISLTFLGL